jgi:hypothetical protein
MRDQRRRVGGQVRRALIHRLAERARAEMRLLPAGADELIRGLAGRDIGDADDVKAGNALRLGEEHRRELAATDDADAHRLAGGGAGGEELVEIHGSAPKNVYARPALTSHSQLGEWE